MSRDPLTSLLVGVDCVVKNTFVEFVDAEIATPLRRRAHSAEPLLKPGAVEDSPASRLPTPDFNTKGAFDQQDWDACSDASDCSRATADWAGWTNPAQIATRTIPTQDSRPALLASAADLLHQRATKTSDITLTVKFVKSSVEQTAPKVKPSAPATTIESATPTVFQPMPEHECRASMSSGQLTMELLDAHYVVKNTFVELIDPEIATPLRRRAHSAEPLLKPGAVEDSPASRLPTPDFNTKGAFDWQDWDACSDASDCSRVTADWVGWTEPVWTVAGTRADGAEPATLTAKFVKDHAEQATPMVKPAVTAKPKPSADRSKCKQPKAKGVGPAPSESPPWGSSRFGTGVAHGNQGTAGVTLMVHNVPCRRPAKFLFDEFAELGFLQGCMDYVYLPMREKGGRAVGTGYMFVNLVTLPIAEAFFAAVNEAEITDPACTSAAPKRVFCSRADTQGVDANLATFLQSKGQGLRNAAWLRGGSHWRPVLR